jgi:hypothetical protein
MSSLIVRNASSWVASWRSSPSQSRQCSEKKFHVESRIQVGPEVGESLGGFACESNVPTTIRVYKTTKHTKFCWV